jgi:phosphoglycolate phosphatase
MHPRRAGALNSKDGFEVRAIGILFDKDGTLLDFEATFAPACALVVRELAAGDEARANAMATAIGFDLAGQIFAADSVAISGHTADLARAWEPLLAKRPELGFAGRIDALFGLHTRETATPFEGAAAALSALAARGLRIGLATNDAESNGRTHVEAAGLGHLVEFFAGYDSGHGAKPGPGMVEAFARHCGCSTAQILMVGDSCHDMSAARAAGAVAIAVTTGPASRAELTPFADAVIDGLDELANLPWLEPTEAGA